MLTFKQFTKRKKETPSTEIYANQSDSSLPAVTELFDSHLPYKHTFSKAGLHGYRFNSPSGSSHAVYVRHDNKGSANVLFSDKNGNLEANREHPRDAHKILSTVHHITREHLKKHPAEHVTFSSKGESRTGLYRRMIKKSGKEHSETQSTDKTATMFKVKT